MRKASALQRSSSDSAHATYDYRWYSWLEGARGAMYGGSVYRRRGRDRRRRERVVGREGGCYVQVGALLSAVGTAPQLLVMLIERSSCAPGVGSLQNACKGARPRECGMHAEVWNARRSAELRWLRWMRRREGRGEIARVRTVVCCMDASCSEWVVGR